MKAVYPISLKENHLFLSEEDTKHLFFSLRAKEKERIFAYFEGHKYLTEISFSPSYCLKIIREEEMPSYPNPFLTLHFALLKGGHDEWVIEKGVELGCLSFAPFISSFTISRPKAKKEFEKRETRFQKIGKESAYQCGSPFLPHISPITSFETSMKEAKGIRLFFDEKRAGEDFSYKEFFKEKKGNFDVFIGPEGGFSEKEREFAGKMGAIILPLSSLILRAETASIAVCSLFHFASMEGLWR